jgi:hypothetical protein
MTYLTNDVVELTIREAKDLNDETMHQIQPEGREYPQSGNGTGTNWRWNYLQIRLRSGAPGKSTSEFFRIPLVAIRNFRGFLHVLATAQLCLQTVRICRKIILHLRFQPESAKCIMRLLTGLL